LARRFSATSKAYSRPCERIKRAEQERLAARHQHKKSATISPTFGLQQETRATGCPRPALRNCHRETMGGAKIDGLPTKRIPAANNGTLQPSAHQH